MPAKFCSNCGTAIQPGEKFCAGCGTPLANTGEIHDNTPTPQPDIQPLPEPVYPQHPGVPADSLYPQQPAVNPYNAQPGYPAAPVVVKKTMKTARIVIGCFTGFIVLIAIAVFVWSNILTTILNKAAESDYYTMGSDQIPSIKQIVGKRSINSTETSTSNGVTTMKFVYNDNQSPQQDLIDYTVYLRESEGFTVTVSYDLNKAFGSAQLAKESLDEGKIIIMDIEYDSAGYTLVLTKCAGTLTKD